MFYSRKKKLRRIIMVIFVPMGVRGVFEFYESLT